MWEGFVTPNLPLSIFMGEVVLWEGFVTPTFLLVSLWERLSCGRVCLVGGVCNPDLPHTIPYLNPLSMSAKMNAKGDSYCQTSHNFLSYRTRKVLQSVESQIHGILPLQGNKAILDI